MRALTAACCCPPSRPRPLSFIISPLSHTWLLPSLASSSFSSFFSFFFLRLIWFIHFHCGCSSFLSCLYFILVRVPLVCARQLSLSCPCLLSLVDIEDAADFVGCSRMLYDNYYCTTSRTNKTYERESKHTNERTRFLRFARIILLCVQQPVNTLIRTTVVPGTSKYQDRCTHRVHEEYTNAETQRVPIIILILIILTCGTSRLGTVLVLLYNDTQRVSYIRYLVPRVNKYRCWFSTDAI